jgi:hypothetical protein
MGGLGQQPVHDASALGLLGVVDRPHPDPGFALESWRIGSEKTWSSET